MSLLSPFHIKFVLVSCLIFGVLSWKHSFIGVRDALVLGGRTCLLLCFFTLATQCFPRIRALLSPARPNEHEEDLEDAEAKIKQEVARREQQAVLTQRASHYKEHIQLPRKETLLRKKEEKFYRMTGQTWKLTEGETLGEDLCEESASDREVESDHQRAIRRRKLPERVVHPPPQPDPPLTKRVIVLPDEPLESTEGALNLAMRYPSGRTVYRRFLQSHPSSVLIDWMLKCGYHPSVYTLVMSYPRKPLLVGPLMTLEDLGIVKNTLLNIEEKDPSDN